MAGYRTVQQKKADVMNRLDPIAHRHHWENAPGPWDRLYRRDGVYVALNIRGGTVYGEVGRQQSDGSYERLMLRGPKRAEQVVALLTERRA